MTKNQPMKPPLYHLILGLFLWPISAAADPPIPEAAKADSLSSYVTSARSGIKDLKTVVAEVKLNNNYVKKDHDSTVKALSHVSGQLDLIKAKAQRQSQVGDQDVAGLSDTVSSASELEKQLWEGIGTEVKDGMKIVPLLLPALESVTTAFDRLFPQQAAGPPPNDPFGMNRNQGIKNAAGAVNNVDVTEAKSDNPSQFWEKQQTRQKEVDGPSVAANDFNSMSGRYTPESRGFVFTPKDKGKGSLLLVPGVDNTFSGGGVNPMSSQGSSAFPSVLRDSARSANYAASLTGFPVRPGIYGEQNKKEEKVVQPVKPPPKLKTAAELAAEESLANCLKVLHEHPKIAQMCKDSPNLAPLIAGFMEALIEQFGTIQGLLTNLVFMLLGLVLSALSGFGLIAKVAVSLVSFGFLIYTLGPLLKDGYNAASDWWKSKDGSTMKFDSLKRMGKIGGSVMIMALMAAIGWGVGKTKPGKAAMASMEGAVSAKMAGMGISKVGKLDSMLPSSAKSLLTRVFGEPKNPVADGPDQVAKATEPKPVEPVKKTAQEKGKTADKTPDKPILTSAEKMAKNQKHIQEATDDLFRQLQKNEGDLGKVPYDQMVKVFDKIDDFPAEVPGRPASILKREEAVAAFAKDYLGIKEPVKVVAPDVKPASGAEIYKIQVGGKDVGVFKIFNKQGAPELMRELGSGSVYKGAGIEGMSTVKSMGAFRIGESGRIGYFMETAPGNNLYAAMKGVRGHKGKSLSIDEVKVQVEAVGKVLSEIHKKTGKSTVVSRQQKQQIVDKVKANLETMLRPDEGKGRGWTLSEKEYRQLKSRVEAQGKAFVEAEGTVGVVNHGDGHPGNFYYDPKTKKVTVIDIETTMESFNIRGEGTMSRGNDVSRFMESIRLNNESKGLGLQPKEIAALQTAFIESYSKSSGIKPSVLKTEIDFYNNKLYVAALKSAKTHADFQSFLKIILGE